MRHTWSSTPCGNSWPPFCLPLFTSDGLHVYFYALTAHVGQWLAVSRGGQKVRQWQVAAGLMDGQVKKSYRRGQVGRGAPHERPRKQAEVKDALPGPGPL